MVEFGSDATLLDRFVSRREEAAFVALVRRHGPRVERVCRRILRNEHDVEDVLQTTFLVLARKASGIPWRESIGPWLDNVARRLALHARSGASRKSGRETTVTALLGGLSDRDGRLPERFHPRIEPSVEVERRDLRRVLDDELLQLPEKYRAPVVLCDLEGWTREEAARQLGWPTGSMSRRLDRGRTLLRRRLTHRGVALAVIGLASVAAAAIGLRTDRSRPGASVRQVMASFKPETEGGRGYGAILAAARMEGTRPEFNRILPAALEAASAARRLEGNDAHSPWAALWDQFARDMKSSALDLERACRESNALAVVGAARRLDASCLGCHAAFRQGLDHPSLPPTDAAIHCSPSVKVSRRPGGRERAATVGDRERIRPIDTHPLTLAALTTRPASSRPRGEPDDASSRSTAVSPSRLVVANEWEATSVKRDDALHSVTALDCWEKLDRAGAAHPPEPSVGGRCLHRIRGGSAGTLI
jgi:RNA polymerase sigma-70 factor (ECF subfamily)